MKLTTHYLGLPLKNPVLVGASSLTYQADTLLEMEEAGAAAIVMHSLFEEQIAPTRWVGYEGLSATSDDRSPESKRFPLSPKRYLQQLEKLKGCLKIPVIGSLNGIHPGPWLALAGQMADHGADALELNLYDHPADAAETGEAVERRALEIVARVVRYAKVPLAVKLSPFYSSLPAFVGRLEAAGATGVVLFNRFIQTDLDLASWSYRPTTGSVGRDGFLMRLRWISLLHGRTGLDLCLSGGVRSASEVLKAVVAGANTVQVVSLLKGGPPALRALLAEMAEGIAGGAPATLEEVHGALSFARNANINEVTRSGYLRSLQAFATEEGFLRPDARLDEAADEASR